MSEQEKLETQLKNEWETAGKKQMLELGNQLQLPTDLSLACGVSLFLSSLKGQSEQTHKTYRIGCRTFMLFIHEKKLGDPVTLAITSLSGLILEDYYLWLVERYSRSKKATVAGYMAGPRNLFAYLARREISPQNMQYSKMVAGLSKLAGRSSYKSPRVEYSEVRDLAQYLHKLVIPSLDDLLNLEKLTLDEAVRNYFTTRRKLNQQELINRRLELLRDKAIILTLYATGLRREEVSRLNKEDVRDGRKDEAIITGKGDKERVVFFEKNSLEAIKAYLVARDDKYAPLFIQHRLNAGEAGANGKNLRLSPFGIWKVVEKWAKVVGVSLSPHDFRHGLATAMLNNGAQLSEVQDILGHASPTTTKQIYAHYEKRTLRAAITKHRPNLEENTGVRSQESE